MAQNRPTLFDLEDKDYSNYCGIDEAGRGPIAGSLVVAAVVLKNDIAGLKDSKKLTQKRREELYSVIKNNSNYYIYEASAQKVDEFGLSKLIKEALTTIKNHFSEHNILFDGNSTFGVSGIETLIKADDKVECVKAASILAKVYRDNQMIEYAKTYPEYGFERHKGYGVKAHIEAIAKHGYCDIHRKSFKIKLPNKATLLTQ